MTRLAKLAGGYSKYRASKTNGVIKTVSATNETTLTH